MKMKDIQNRNTEELMQMLKDNRGGLRDFRFQVGQGKAKNNKQGREMKRTIARILTHLNTKHHG
ncbi:MAG: 50S ribosomal protein L29 [Candidatus Niyogibacteria bacterium CG10_big_fil_rev_8_21_14_0_10_46_36]|uniref:Large ribosomal subunit protein uL29 n=1 Tax=Candidatus Niyogibacteria bacterium CG10_big_fil_rev_8_21_14_0_10_46_36 TaxID=1974726 RepID=A0A2H0TDX8_9BACT|nr:MAG: 50S ribosomal protein L29 [Candidatus Niyogibacteria bacterium CG10_big_fil_rev_8_21_14_0_10_46_36]